MTYMTMLKVKEVGIGFIPSPKMSVVLGELLKIAAPPDYCTDAEACLEALEPYCSTVMCKPTLDGRHVALFDFGEHFCVTAPFRCEAFALSAALHYVLSSISHD